jgi:ketosteroid isomerase-like protein
MLRTVLRRSAPPSASAAAAVTVAGDGAGEAEKAATEKKKAARPDRIRDSTVHLIRVRDGRLKKSTV